MQKRNSVHLRHVDVDDRQIERLQQQFLQTLQPILSLFDDEPALLQGRAIIRSDESGIVDNKDPFPGKLAHVRNSCGLR